MDISSILSSLHLVRISWEVYWVASKHGVWISWAVYWVAGSAVYAVFLLEQKITADCLTPVILCLPFILYCGIWSPNSMFVLPFDSWCTAIQIGGVRTNFSMPDVRSIPLGGGTLVVESDSHTVSLSWKIKRFLCVSNLTFWASRSSITHLVLCYTPCNTVQLHIL